MRVYTVTVEDYTSAGQQRWSWHCTCDDSQDGYPTRQAARDAGDTHYDLWHTDGPEAA